MNTVTYCEMERAALALFTANLDKECEFTTWLKHLLAQPRVHTLSKTQGYRDCKIPIDKAQCDHPDGWRNFSLRVFEKEPNICSNHIICK